MAVAVSTATQKLTFEQWRSLPETKQRYEIVDGAASTPVSCSLEHQWVLQNILFRGMKFDHETDLGEFTMSPRPPVRLQVGATSYLGDLTPHLRRNKNSGYETIKAP